MRRRGTPAAAVRACHPDHGPAGGRNMPPARGNLVESRHHAVRAMRPLQGLSRALGKSVGRLVIRLADAGQQALRQRNAVSGQIVRQVIRPKPHPVRSEAQRPGEARRTNRARPRSATGDQHGGSPRQITAEGLHVRIICGPREVVDRRAFAVSGIAGLGFPPPAPPSGGPVTITSVGDQRFLPRKYLIMPDPSPGSSFHLLGQSGSVSTSTSGATTVTPSRSASFCMKPAPPSAPSLPALQTSMRRSCPSNFGSRRTTSASSSGVRRIRLESPMPTQRPLSS